MFGSKSKEVKNGLILNVLFTLFVHFLVENQFFFQITSLSVEKCLKLKCSADQILAMKSEFVSFDLLRVDIVSFSTK